MLRSISVVLCVVFTVVFAAYSFWLFTNYGPWYTELVYTNNRVKRNVEPPSHDYAQFQLTGGPEWNDARLEDYQVYSFDSCLNNSLPVEYVSIVDHKNDSTCTTTIQDSIMARVRWRGNTKPPLKVTLKLKLYYCRCVAESDDPTEELSCEWKKRKISSSDSCIGYSGEGTNEWTLRSDRWDTVTLRDWFSWRFFEYMGGRDDMWGTFSTLKVNSQQMGLYLFVTSPEKELIEGSVGFDEDQDYFWEYTNIRDKYFATGQLLELKEPDPEDWCNVLNPPNPSSCDNETIRVTEFQNLVRPFANGAAQIDNQTMAARFWMQAMSRDLDAMSSKYFYSVNSVVFAGPVWDHGSAFASPKVKCLDSRIANSKGWLSTAYDLYAPYLDQPHFYNYTQNAWKNRDPKAFIANFTGDVDESVRTLIRYDWSLWKNVEQFTCVPGVFSVGGSTRDNGGYLKYDLPSIDTQVDDFLSFVRQRAEYLDDNVDHINFRDEESPMKPFGPLTVAWIVLLVAVVVSCLVALVIITCTRFLPNTSRGSMGEYLIQ
jgi:hypothetical protein